MTDQQIADHIMSGDNYAMQESLMMVIKGMFGEKPDARKAFLMMRQALKEGKTFFCAYDDGESCSGARKSNFDMWIG